MKNVQIPEALFLQMLKYFVLDIREEDMEQSIRKGIEAKVDAIIKHDLYTQYKTAPTPEQQEQARQAYLDKVGMRDSFRWAQKGGGAS